VVRTVVALIALEVVEIESSVVVVVVVPASGHAQIATEVVVAKGPVGTQPPQQKMETDEFEFDGFVTVVALVEIVVVVAGVICDNGMYDRGLCGSTDGTC
jgi:hypothetical protein